MRAMKKKSFLQKKPSPLHYIMQFISGEMAEWSKAAASKAAILCKWNRGFESLSLFIIGFST